MIETIGDLLIEGLEFDDGEVRIDLRQSFPGDFFHIVDGPLRLQHQRPGIQREILVDRFFVARRPLRDRNEVHAVVFPA